jgi:hypothetical protein
LPTLRGLLQNGWLPVLLLAISGVIGFVVLGPIPVTYPVAFSLAILGSILAIASLLLLVLGYGTFAGRGVRREPEFRSYVRFFLLGLIVVAAVGVLAQTVTGNGWIFFGQVGSVVVLQFYLLRRYRRAIRSRPTAGGSPGTPPGPRPA